MKRFKPCLTRQYAIRNFPETGVNYFDRRIAISDFHDLCDVFFKRTDILVVSIGQLTSFINYIVTYDYHHKQIT